MNDSPYLINSSLSFAVGVTVTAKPYTVNSNDFSSTHAAFDWTQNISFYVPAAVRFEVFRLVGYGAASLGDLCPVFRESVVVSHSQTPVNQERRHIQQERRTRFSVGKSDS
jgi:hypothetical protein